MYPQRFRVTVMASPRPNGRKQTSTINKKDAYISQEDFPDANHVCTEIPSFQSHRGIKRSTHTAPYPAQLASKFESKSHSIRLRFPPRSIAAVHLRQKRISFIPCPVVHTGTNTASGDSASVHGLSMKSDRTMLNTSAVSLPQLP